MPNKPTKSARERPFRYDTGKCHQDFVSAAKLLKRILPPEAQNPTSIEYIKAIAGNQTLALEVERLTNVITIAYTALLLAHIERAKSRIAQSLNGEFPLHFEWEKIIVQQIHKSGTSIGELILAVEGLPDALLETNAEYKVRS